MSVTDRLRAAEAMAASNLSMMEAYRTEAHDMTVRAEAAEAQRDTAIAILTEWRGSKMPDRVAILRLENLYGVAAALAGVAPPEPREDVLAALRDGPRSSDQLGVDTGFLRAMEADGLVKIDPDAFPDEFVPGNPFVARLPADERPWPGWKAWNR